MKRVCWIALIVFALFAFAIPAQAQQTQVKTPIEELEGQLNSLQTQLATAKAEATRKKSPWEGIGNEIGTAARESISGLIHGIDEGATITLDHAERFAQTPLGKGTIFIVGWKILGKDIMEIMDSVWLNTLGFIFMVMFFMALRYMYTVFFVGRMVVTKIEGKVKTKERTKPINDQLSDEAYGVWIAISILVLTALFVGMTSCFINAQTN